MWVRVGKRFGKIMYKCDHPDCYAQQDRQVLIGKRTICAICRKNEFFATADDLRRSRPRCIFCSDRAVSVEKRRLTAMVSDVLNDTFKNQEEEQEKLEWQQPQAKKL